jgi:hypothetical protein
MTHNCMPAVVVDVTMRRGKALDFGGGQNGKWHVLDSHQLEMYLLPMAEPHRVFVVVDQEYGGRLGELAQTGPVWIVDTPANRTIAQQIWAANPNRSHLNVVTTFKFEEGSSSEDILINELDTIDLHHGTYSANPPYTVLEVIGTGISARLKTELSQFGFGEFQETSEGFRAVRPLIDQRGQNV